MYVIICKSTKYTSTPGVISILSDGVGRAVVYNDAEQAEQVARSRSALGYFTCAVVPLSTLQFLGNV
jgi:hypothetical protein